jgi:hypothetical protein
MPFIIADRVRESSTTVGTGSIALAGAVTGYQTFDAVLDTTDTTFYTFADQGGANWEVGIGTFTAPSTLARTTILSSSNGGSIVNFGAGTKDVFISLPASRTNVNDQPNVISVNSTSNALRITQTGTGNALVVEDSANPDATPFVVDASGNVLLGTTTTRTIAGQVPEFLIERPAAARAAVVRNTADANGPLLFTAKSRGTANGSFVVVSSGDALGTWNFAGSDGTADVVAASIRADVDGTPGTNDMPGRLVFSTTADGASTPTERMRITQAGNVGIGTTAPGSPLTVTNASADPLVALNATGTQNNAVLWLRNGVSNGAIYQENAGAFHIRNFTAQPSIFWTNNAERMRIDDVGDVGIGTTNPTARLNVVDATSQDAVRITQTGTGNALVVEDAANPDATPFIIGPEGEVRIGFTGSVPVASVIARQFQSIVLGDPPSGSGGASFSRFSNDASGAVFALGKSRGTSASLFTVVNSGDSLGAIRWAGSDGTDLISQAAEIRADVDGTPGNDDMPGRLVFSTTADGASTPTERMRIDNAGQVQVGAGTVGAPALSTLADTNTGIFFPAADTMAFVEGGTEAARIDSSANLLVNTTTAVSRLTVNGDVAGTFFVNPTTVSANYTIPTNYNAMTAGPITVNSGITVTVGSGSVWTIT